MINSHSLTHSLSLPLSMPYFLLNTHYTLALLLKTQAARCIATCLRRISWYRNKGESREMVLHGAPELSEQEGWGWGVEVLEASIVPGKVGRDWGGWKLKEKETVEVRETEREWTLEISLWQHQLMIKLCKARGEVIVGLLWQPELGGRWEWRKGRHRRATSASLFPAGCLYKLLLFLVLISITQVQHYLSYLRAPLNVGGGWDKSTLKWILCVPEGGQNELKVAERRRHRVWNRGQILYKPWMIEIQNTAVRQSEAASGCWWIKKLRAGERETERK